MDCAHTSEIEHTHTGRAYAAVRQVRECKVPSMRRRRPHSYSLIHKMRVTLLLHMSLLHNAQRLPCHSSAPPPYDARATAYRRQKLRPRGTQAPQNLQVLDPKVRGASRVLRTAGPKESRKPAVDPKQGVAPERSHLCRPFRLLGPPPETLSTHWRSSAPTPHRAATPGLHTSLAKKRRRQLRARRSSPLHAIALA